MSRRQKPPPPEMPTRPMRPSESKQGVSALPKGYLMDDLPTGDLLALTAALIDIGSVSFNEGPIADALEAELAGLAHLETQRVGDNLVARTNLGRGRRIILAGHTDTVPPAGNDRARIDGDTLWGLGASDMKSGVAVLLELARTVTDPAADVSYVLYAREEVDSRHSGLKELAEVRPDLLRPMSPCWPSRPTAPSRPAARERCGCGPPWRGRGPTPPGPGWAATPSTGWPGCSTPWPATSPAAPMWTTANTARGCRRWP